METIDDLLRKFDEACGRYNDAREEFVKAQATMQRAESDVIVRAAMLYNRVKQLPPETRALPAYVE